MKDIFHFKTDTPPGTSDEHLTVVKVLKNVNPDGAIIVSTSQMVALATVRKEITFCRKMGLKILGVVENMSGFVCPCCQVRTTKKILNQLSVLNIDLLQFCTVKK